MKVIEIPGPVGLKYKVAIKETGAVEDRSQDSSMEEFLGSCCERFEGFAKGPKMARQYGKIMDKIEALNGDKELVLDDADYSVVRDAVNAAGWLTPEINRAYLPFYDAVENAKDE